MWFLWDLLPPCWWSTDMSPINANVNSFVESTTKQSHFFRWTRLETIGRQVPKSCHFLHECGPSGSGLPPIFCCWSRKQKCQTNKSEPDKKKSEVPSFTHVTGGHQKTTPLNTEMPKKERDENSAQNSVIHSTVLFTQRNRREKPRLFEELVAAGQILETKNLMILRSKTAFEHL